VGDGPLESRCFENDYIPREIRYVCDIAAVMDVIVIETDYIVLLIFFKTVKFRAHCNSPFVLYSYESWNFAVIE
jgi:hypothetical protein